MSETMTNEELFEMLDQYPQQTLVVPPVVITTITPVIIITSAPNSTDRDLIPEWLEGIR